MPCGQQICTLGGIRTCGFQLKSTFTLILTGFPLSIVYNVVFVYVVLQDLHVAGSVGPGPRPPPDDPGTPPDAGHPAEHLLPHPEETQGQPIPADHQDQDGHLQVPELHNASYDSNDASQEEACAAAVGAGEKHHPGL